MKESRTIETAKKKVALIHKLLPAVVHLTAQIIRTLRTGILMEMRWGPALELFRTATKSHV